MYEILVLTSSPAFLRNYGLLPAAQFAYRKGLGRTDALLTKFHHHQKSLDAGMESYIILLLDFSAAFDRVSHISAVTVGVCSLFVWSSSPTIGRESSLMVLQVSGPLYFSHATGNCVGSSTIYSIYQRNF